MASQATAMDDITWLQAHTNYTYYGTNVTRVCIVVEFIDKHSDIWLQVVAQELLPFPYLAVFVLLNRYFSV